MTAANVRARLGIRQVTESLRRLVEHSDWNVGLVDRPIEAFVSGWDPATVTWLPIRRGRYAADPFGFVAGGRTNVLFEDYDQRRARAVISHVELAPDGTAGPPETVLDAGVHASYPFVVESDGAVFMIPETADARELRLYRAADLPRRWALETVLLPNQAVSDPTVIEHDGRWWLFGTSRGRGVDECLRIWHAPRLTGPWQLHRRDPVKTDIASARPAGTPFRVAGAWHRPAQDSSRRYGGAVVVNRIDRLTPDEFEEHPITRLAPFPGSAYPDGFHTLSAVGTQTLIDGNHLGFVPGALLAIIERRLGLPQVRPTPGGVRPFR